jgi:hypothetical protein
LFRLGFRWSSSWGDHRLISVFERLHVKLLLIKPPTPQVGGLLDIFYPGVGF